MWLVTLYPDANRDEFIAWMKAYGFAFKEFEFIPLVFEVEEPFDHKAIKMIEDGEWRQSRPAARQTITVQPDLQGPDNWALARVIRRNRPWVFDRSFTGINSFFEAGLDGSGVDIYVVDSGFNTSHVEITGRATNVSDHTSGNANVDQHGHGTACSSLASGVNLGMARGSLLWSFRCFDSTNTGQTSWTVSAINAAIAHYNGRSALNRAAVMNLSLTGGAATGVAATSAVQAGIVVIAAAGNDNIDCVDISPASATGILCVGGINTHDGPYYYSTDGTNWGTQVDILSPSFGVRVADYTGNSSYRIGRGTSYGCAFATGVVACLLTGKPRLTQAQVATVRQFVIDTATTGRFKEGPTPGPLPDRIIYIDPSLISSPISFVG